VTRRDRSDPGDTGDHGALSRLRAWLHGPGTRAVSEVVGFALVFSLVVAVVAIVSLNGISTLQEARNAEQTNNAERAFEVLADNMKDLHTNGAPSRATEISPPQGSGLYMGARTTIWINDTSAPTLLPDRKFHVRPIVYRGADGTEIFYMMGALFRVEPNDRGERVLRDWQVLIDEQRTVFPIVNTTGTGSLYSSTVLVRAETRDRELAAVNTTGDYDDVTITVESPRRTLWKRMLEEHDGVSCSTPSSELVQCTLDFTPERLYVSHTRIRVDIEQ
jgi:hypothetical protein